MKSLFILLLITFHVLNLRLVRGCCANGCSGHGVCGDGTCACTCFSQFTGADCSLRKCPVGKQWFGPATSTDEVHETLAECSNMGECDRSTGFCLCQEGFTGVACERMTCPDDCSGHGECISLKQAASFKDDVHFYRLSQYEEWDAEKVYMCKCDFGYTGRTCALRGCLYGDDPVTTTDTLDEIQLIDCTCATTCSGFIKLQFKSEKTGLISHDATAAIIKAKLEELRNIEEITVTQVGGTTLCDPDGVSSVITFTHNSGNVPSLRVIASSLTSTGSIPTLNVIHDGAVSAESVISVTGTKERLSCNGRGHCDYSSGLCDCLNGFTHSDGTGSAGYLNDCGFASQAADDCPTMNAKDCSGNGICSEAPDFKCTCYSGYSGIDCSVQTCPKGKAWLSEPGETFPGRATINDGDAFITTTEDLRSHINRGDEFLLYSSTTNEVTKMIVSTDAANIYTGNTMPISVAYAGTTIINAELFGQLTNAHPLSECSNRGTCFNGACTCDNGFHGVACDRLVCQSNCNDRGICMSLSDRATLTEINGVQQSFSYGVNQINSKTWDHDKIQGCVCDEKLNQGGLYNFNGHACQKRTCITGEEPSLAERIGFNSKDIQMLTCTGEGGSFKLTFRDQTTGEISFDATETDVKIELEALSKVTEISVSFNVGSTVCSTSPGVETLITFEIELGDLPLLVPDDSSLTGTSPGIIVTKHQTGNRLAFECSNHGLCNRDTGVCECFNGYVSSDGKGNRGLRGDCSFRDALFKA